MGLFGLGLIGGAAQGFSDFKTRQREDENLRKQQEREDKLRGEERAWQLMQFEFQTLSQQQQALFTKGLEDEQAAEAREFEKNQLKNIQDANPDYLIFPQKFAAMQRKKTASSLYVPPFPNSDPTKPSFVYTNKRGEPVGFPGFDADVVKDKAERSNFFRQALSLIPPDEVAYHLDRYERRNDPNFTGQDFISQYMNTIGTYRQELTNALTYKEGDKIFIRAPNYDFGLDRLPPEVAERFATTVFPSLFGIGVDEIRKTFKVPKQVPVTYDQFTNTFQINEKVVNDSRWAIEKDPNGDWVYNPQIFAQGREIAGHSGTKVINVMTFAGTSSTPEKRLNNILNAKAVFGNTLVKDNSGLYRTTPAFNTAIIPLISNLTEKDALQFLRLIVPAGEGAPVRSFQMTEGSAKPIYSKLMNDVIGTTPEEARIRFENAERARQVMVDMRQLQEQFGVKEGGIGQFRVTIAGVADFLEAGVGLIQGYGKTGDPQNDELRNEHISELKTFAQKIRNGDQVGAQALFNMLARHATYYIAGAVQGGAQGRAISDFDIKNNAEAMQLDRYFSATDGAKINLEYLIDQMELYTTIYGAYMSPQNAEDLQATFLFEQVVRAQPNDIKKFMENLPDRSAVSASAVPTPSKDTPGVEFQLLSEIKH
jgi:hypothetical protein